jgi:hypothetical protein
MHSTKGRKVFVACCVLNIYLQVLIRNSHKSDIIGVLQAGLRMLSLLYLQGRIYTY